jgi:3-hydroxymyristoyl/3-hydroxydecanoyl-(acyl carrier protein) dehydratase
VRWRFADRITAFEPWARIAGRKAVSLEEYALLDRFGRGGVLPESLVLETCVEHLRWLAAASSGFREACFLEEVERFAFAGRVGMADVLEVSVALSGPAREGRLAAQCRVACAGRAVAEGSIRARLVPLAESFEPERVELLWREIHAPA